jgi:hypothetical protein
VLRTNIERLEDVIAASIVLLYGGVADETQPALSSLNGGLC